MSIDQIRNYLFRDPADAESVVRNMLEDGVIEDTATLNATIRPRAIPLSR
jgi:hypothetical protein